jgi:hypothetical protein
MIPKTDCDFAIVTDKFGSEIKCRNKLELKDLLI